LSLKLKVYIPENRKVEKWLQDFIDMPDHEPAKLAIASCEDWPTGDCLSKMIAEGLRAANHQYTRASHLANDIRKQEDRFKGSANEDSDDSFWSESEEDLKERLE
jgi:hypothetical protein